MIQLCVLYEINDPWDDKPVKIISVHVFLLSDGILIIVIYHATVCCHDKIIGNIFFPKHEASLQKSEESRPALASFLFPLWTSLLFLNRFAYTLRLRACRMHAMQNLANCLSSWYAKFFFILS